MKNEIRFRYVNPEEPLHEGMQNRNWINKEEIKECFPYQLNNNNSQDLYEIKATLLKIIPE